MSDKGGIRIRLWERIVPLFFWLMLIAGGAGFVFTIFSFYQAWSQGWVMIVTIVSCLLTISGLLGVMAYGSFLREDLRQPERKSDLVKH